MKLREWLEDDTDEKTHPVIAILMPIVFVIIGVIMLQLCVATTRHMLRPLPATTKATVVEYEIDRNQGEDHGTTYDCVYSFADKNGRTYRVIGNLGNFQPTHAIGDRVTLHYDPSDPAHVYRLDDELPSTIMAIVLAGAGGIATIAIGITSIKRSMTELMPPQSQTWSALAGGHRTVRNHEEKKTQRA